MSDTLHKQKIAVTEAQNECEAAGEHDAHAFARRYRARCSMAGVSPTRRQ